MEEALRTVLPEQYDYLAPIITGGALGILILIVGWIVSKWVQVAVRRVLKNRSVDLALAGFLSSLAQWLVLAAAAITALGKVGVETTSLIALLGAAGLAIGLALQGSLSNLASGVMILLFRPFTVADKITAAGHTGVVEDVGLFASTMTTPRNDTIIVPNSELMASSIVNHSKLGAYRCAVSIGVAYGTDFQKAEQAILKALAHGSGCARRSGALGCVRWLRSVFSGSRGATLVFARRRAQLRARL